MPTLAQRVRFLAQTALYRLLRYDGEPATWARFYSVETGASPARSSRWWKVAPVADAGRPVSPMQVLRRTLADLWAAQVMELAAALAFYAVLSIFPLVLAGAALASWVVPAPVVTERLSALVEGSLPPGVVDLDPIVASAIAARGRVGLFVIILWLLAGRRIFGALVTALDRVSDVDARQETVTRRAWV